MTTHSSMLAFRIPWTEEPGRLPCMGRKESDMTEQLSTFIFIVQSDQKHEYRVAFFFFKFFKCLVDFTSETITYSGLLFVRIFLITDSVFLLVIDLFLYNAVLVGFAFLHFI